MFFDGTVFFIKPINTPLEGVKIIGWVHPKTDWDYEYFITETLTNKYTNKGGVNYQCPHAITKSDILKVKSGDTSDVMGGATWWWHRDSHGGDYTVLVSRGGPSTEFCEAALPEKGLRGKVWELKGRKCNFPENVLLLVDHRKVAHRTPPWICNADNRQIGRWFLYNKEDQRY